MKKNTRTKSVGLASDAEFYATLNRVAAIQLEIVAIGAARDHAVQQAQLESATAIAELQAEIDGKLALCEKYGSAHRKELLEPDKKSAETAVARWGFRLGNRTVKMASRGITEADAIAVLKANKLGGYVRQLEELAKDKILSEAVTDEKLGGVTLTNSDGEALRLVDLGLKIHQGETFFIEAKVDTAETARVAS